MCIPLKTWYTCNHTYLSPEPIVVCQAQKDHVASKAKEPCDVIETHARHTVKLSKPCPYCEGKKVTLDQKIASARSLIDELRKHLDETYGNCMKHLDEAGLEPEKKPGAEPAETEQAPAEELDPVQEFLRKKMSEEHAHLMMYSGA